MTTAIYSILHLFVDGTCAFAMFGRFVGRNEGYWYFLIYNFCAFALQMPFGVMLDLILLKFKCGKRSPHAFLPFVCSAVGVVITVIGAITHPAILGIGNALFHVGGGVGVIHEDYVNKWKGSALGVFVAPGAFGLFIGTQLAKQSGVHMESVFLVFISLIMFGLLAILGHWNLKNNKYEKKILEKDFGSSRSKNSALALTISCFAVVILRSYVGMTVTFSWKTSMLLGAISVLAVVFGKMAGGILAAKLDVRKVVFISLVFSALGYLFSENAVLGVLALFFFNMTMPITLYLLVDQFKELPGFSFGVLTFGLFLGFLPAYLEMDSPLPGNVTGMAGSIISLVILMIAVWSGNGIRQKGGAGDVDRLN